MVVFDTSFLLHLIDPNLAPPIDPNSERPVENSHRRVKFLVNDLNESHEKIIIPTPALGELLILAGQAGRYYLDIFTRASVFQIEPFDVRAAVELAIMSAKDIKSGDKKAGSTASMAKVKFDRQIVAVAKVNGGSPIYTNDTNLKKFAESQDIETLALWDLPLPPEDAQLDWLEQGYMQEAPVSEIELEEEGEEDEVED